MDCVCTYCHAHRRWKAITMSYITRLALGCSVLSLVNACAKGGANSDAAGPNPAPVTVRADPARLEVGFPNSNDTSEDQIAALVTAFIARDAQASHLLNPSNRKLFAEGVRPRIGVPHDPEAGGRNFADIQSYFTKKLYLDLSSIRPFDQSAFQSFVDQVGRWSDQTLICAGDIVVEYDLKVEGSFNFQTELAKIPAGPEREEFKSCWLNDFVLAAELRMLGWVHEQLFNTPYVVPEKR